MKNSPHLMISGLGREAPSRLCHRKAFVWSWGWYWGRRCRFSMYCENLDNKSPTKFDWAVWHSARDCSWLWADPDDVKTYDYFDAQGVLPTKSSAYPKSFKQRRPDGNGGWYNQRRCAISIFAASNSQQARWNDIHCRGRRRRRNGKSRLPSNNK